MTTEIPLIDLDEWFGGSPEQRAALAARVDAHLCRLGFLVVVNHRVPQDVIDGCREQARRFFHQPDDVKAAVAMRGEAYRGWVGQGLESNAATYGVATAPDLKETYAFGPVDLPEQAPGEYAPAPRKERAPAEAA